MNGNEAAHTGPKVGAQLVIKNNRCSRFPHSYTNVAWLHLKLRTEMNATEKPKVEIPSPSQGRLLGAQMVLAPSRPQIRRPRIFLAGTTSATGEADWRETLASALKRYPVTLLNPKRDDWDSTWREDFSDNRWAEQVQWELDMQEAADIVVVFFHGISPAPISLLELGLCVRSGKAIVCALQDYSKRGNVEAVCGRFGTLLVETEEALAAAVIFRLQSMGIPLLPADST